MYEDRALIVRACPNDSSKLTFTVEYFADKDLQKNTGTLLWAGKNLNVVWQSPRAVAEMIVSHWPTTMIGVGGES